MSLVGLALVAALAGCATHPGKVGHVRFAADREHVQAQTPEGRLRGLQGNGVRAFLGVPYAAPPVGDLRWRGPRPVRPWNGVRDATRVGRDCRQAIGREAILGGGGGVPLGSEDCLYLNVYRPAAPTGTAAPVLPVMVFLSGGAFTIGAGANYDPSLLAVEQGQVVVTLNHRLGALGWLAHPAFADEGEGVGGNWGLMDQQAALRWVRDNIAAFGGDAADVTVFAESAGAWSACHLMTAPGSAGLWRQLILQSGSCTEPTSLWAADEAAAGGPAFAESVGCPREGAAAVACLRRVPGWRLSRAASTRPGINGPGSWGPVYGDATVPILPPLALARGDFHRTPVLIGSNLDEGRLFAVEVRDRARHDQETVWMYGTRDGPRVLERYPFDAAPPGLAMAEGFTAQKFACPAEAMRRLIAPHAPVRGYEFADRDAPVAVPGWLLPYDLGAYHAAELTYLFGTRWAFADPAEFTPEQAALARRMRDAWAGFGREGFPADWPRAGEDGGPVRVLAPGGDRDDADFSERHQCDFWRSFPYGPVEPAVSGR